MTPTGRVALASRAFTLAATLSVAALLGVEVMRGAVLVLVTAVWAQIFSSTGRVEESRLAVIEGAATGILAAATWPHNDAVTPYLLVPCLVGGLAAGVAGMLRVLAVEAVVTLIAWWLLVDQVDRGTVAHVLTWLFAGVGLGILGLVYRRSLAASGSDSSYRDALALIKRLHALSGKLTEGLDSVSLAEQVIGTASRRLALIQGVVLVPSESGRPIPLLFSDGADADALFPHDEWHPEGWSMNKPLARGCRVVVPLAMESQTVALLVADCLAPPEPRTLTALHEELSPKAVQLHAALLFGDVRDSATSEERQRLAREVHDGIAQDVAFFGYLIDSLLENANDPDLLDQLLLLRQEATRVVTELRHSVFELRNETGVGQGLGQRISSFARHIGSQSDMTVHVTLDEAPARLRSELEAELLRIAQEAINNARKHSGGKNLWVTCEVRPPFAALEVRDDGAGLGAGRRDSHGLHIMRERAERIGADLYVGPAEPDGIGTKISVRLDAYRSNHSIDEVKVSR